MITEDYVSFEVAKLLKEKGFNEECFALYNPSEELIQCGVRLNNTQVGRVEGSYSAPTLQMAMKWLREVHGLNIQPCIVRTIKLKEKAYNATIYDNNCEQIKSHFGRNIFDGFISYEEACESAIKYCLINLI